MKIDLEKKFIIGMIHLLPLKEEKGSSLDDILHQAVKDIQSLISGGITAICLVNEWDYPWQENISDYEKDRFLKVAKLIREKTELPLGICVLYNDWHATLEIADAANLDFARIDVLVDDVICDTGIIKAQPENIIELKQKLCPDLQIFADVHPKYKKILSGRTLIESCTLSYSYPIDGIIITGSQTGESPILDEIQSIRHAFPDKYILAWSGINNENLKEYFQYINWAFIWTALKNKEWDVDQSLVRNLVYGLIN